MKRFVVVVVALAFCCIPASLMAQTISLGTSSQDITISCSIGGPCTVTFASTVSGSTTPSGGYSFTGVGPLTGSSCTAGGGCSLSPGPSGTLTLGGIGSVTPTWTTLDGDGAGYDLDFTTPLSATLDEIFLSPPSTGAANFSALLAAGGSISSTVSSGEVAVPEPASMALLGTALFGAYGLLRRKLKEV